MISRGSAPPALDALESNSDLAMSDLKTEQQETYKTYRVKFRITRSLSSYTESDDYICKIAGEIICSDEAASDSVAGTVEAYVIQVNRIINDGESLFHACDAHSQTVHDYGCVLFDFRSGGLKPAIEDQFGVVGTSDILILDKIEVLPAHRGHGDAFVAGEKRASAKLRAYWSRLGFKQIRGSKKFALSLQHRRPKLKELVPEL